MSMANAGGFAGGAAKGLQSGQQFNQAEDMNPMQLRHMDLQNQSLAQRLAHGLGYGSAGDSIRGVGSEGIRDISGSQPGTPAGLQQGGGGQSSPHDISRLFPVNQMPQQGGGMGSGPSWPASGTGPAPIASGYPGVSFLPGGLNMGNFMAGDPYNTPGGFYGVGGGGF